MSSADSRVHEDNDQPVMVRDNELLSIFRAYVDRTDQKREDFDETDEFFCGLNYKDRTISQDRFCQVYYAIKGGKRNSEIVSAIKTFLQGHFYLTEKAVVMEQIIEEMIANYYRSAQESWDHHTS